MKTKLFPIFAILGIVTMLTFSSCSKDNSSTNSPTQNVDLTKKGVLTCKINGTMWQSNNITMGLFQDTNWLTIVGLRVIGKDTTAIGLSFKLTPSKIGQYSGVFNPTTGLTYGLYYPAMDDKTQLNMFFSYKSSYSMQITKLDMVNKLISGTFSMTLTAPSGGGASNYTITDGVFTDVRIM